MIKVVVQADMSEKGRPPTGDAIEACINQCVADAVEGSFDEYPPHLRGLLRLRAGRGLEETERAADHTRVRFSILLPDELFPIDGGGLQLLVSLLAGDLFPTEVSGCQWSNVAVLDVELSPSLRDEAVRCFRTGRSHSIAELRTAFGLPDRRPLLAFSLKPRVGPTFDEIRTMTLEVLAAGFNLVELDSRNLALRGAGIEKWIELGTEAAHVGTHKTAFSPNLSIPPTRLLSVAEAWVEAVAPHGPAVMKIDGGLDGLSGIQGVRTRSSPLSRPIITCYPALRSQLSTAIGPNAWVDFLSMSGVDIIYPGGQPTFPNERRPVWGAHAADWSRAARAYDQILARGWPMPTLAGGIQPGQLHAYYELLGPRVAYFLGGAVALHPTSPAAGARLCARILDTAVELAAQAEEAGDECADDLPPRLLREVERARYPKTELSYYSPSNIFRLDGARSFVPQTFYRRWSS